MAEHARPADRIRRTWLRWVIVGLAALLLFVAGWVAVRGILAVGELQDSVALATLLRDDLSNGDVAAIGPTVEDIRAHATSAASLTSDPIWRAAEILPGLGPNLSAVREIAGVVSDVADDALPPLAAGAATLSPDTLLADGVVDVDALAAAHPDLIEGAEALARAAATAHGTSRDSVLEPVREAADELDATLADTVAVVDSLVLATEILPAMLGAEQPRTYLMLALTNAELRATGGIPGALAELRIDHGAISLGETSNLGRLERFPEAVTPLTDEELDIYGRRPALFMQNVTMLPDFSRTGLIAREMWRQETGRVVDGVIAIDPVALGYVLNATGSVEVGDGVVLDGSNASDFLLNEVYFRFSDNGQQDALFSRATGAVLASVTSGSYDLSALLGAVTTAVEEGRIHVWSATEAEEDAIVEMPISGVPRGGDSAVGVYLNDGTGAKMDFYLTMSVDVKAGRCEADTGDQVAVRVALGSTVPQDLELPDYVSGAGVFGVAPGTIATSVYLYGPAGAEVLWVEMDGVPVGFHRGVHDGRPVVNISSELLRGQADVIEVTFDRPGGGGAVGVAHTPMSSPVAVGSNVAVRCAP